MLTLISLQVAFCKLSSEESQLRKHLCQPVAVEDNETAHLLSLLRKSTVGKYLIPNYLQ